MVEAERHDPLERIRRYATSEGLWSAEHEAAVMKEVPAAIDDVQRQVEEQPRPGASAMFDHVYEELSSRLEQQRAETIEDATV